MSESLLASKKDESLIPFPNQLFSVTLNAKDPPEVPIPAPALISPVGFSSTVMSIILRSLDEPVIILGFTSFLFMFSAFR